MTYSHLSSEFFVLFGNNCFLLVWGRSCIVWTMKRYQAPNFPICDERGWTTSPLGQEGLERSDIWVTWDPIWAACSAVPWPRGACPSPALLRAAVQGGGLSGCFMSVSSCLVLLCWPLTLPLGENPLEGLPQALLCLCSAGHPGAQSLAQCPHAHCHHCWGRTFTLLDSAELGTQQAVVMVLTGSEARSGRCSLSRK